MKQTIINTNIKKWRPGMVITIVHPGGLRRIFRVKKIPVEYKHLTRRIRQGQKETSLGEYYDKVPLDCNLQLIRQVFIPSRQMTEKEKQTHMFNIFQLAKEIADERERIENREVSSYLKRNNY